MTSFNIFWDGKRMNYPDAFALGFAKLSLVLSGILLFLSLILSIHPFLKKRKQKSKVVNVNNQDSQQSLISSQTQEGSIILLVILLVQMTLPMKIEEFTSQILFWISILIISFTLSLLSGFKFVSTTLAIFFIITIFIVTLIVSISRCAYYNSQLELKSALLSYKWIFLIVGTVLLGYSITLPILFEDSCLCLFNSAYGFPLLLNTYLSTKYTRGLWIKGDICPNYQLCHVYATLPSNTAEAVFINIHAGTNINNLVVKFESDQKEYQSECQQFNFPKDVEEKGQRHLFSCLLNNLESQTVYKVTIYHYENILYSSTYRTMPKKDDIFKKKTRILFGGDFGYLKYGKLIAERVSDYDPDIILIGGDVVYDNGMKSCYYSTDTFLFTFEDQQVKMNRIVPFIFSIGNHDAGFNSMSDYNITINDQNGPYYFSYFPFRFQNETSQSGIPEIKDRYTYNHHVIQDLIIFGLDSGYIHQYEGPQMDWFLDKLEQYPNYYAFSHYHVPIYPTCMSNGSFMFSWQQQLIANRTWVPLFDKYNFVANFENHVHQFKRTFPLKNNKKVDPNEGTVYFGDGSMGVNIDECPESHQTSERLFPGLFDVFTLKDSYHFWIMDINEVIDSSINYIAYDPFKNEINGSYYKQDLTKRKKISDL